MREGVEPYALERPQRRRWPQQNEENDGMERWEKWWNGCTNMGVRLEDCTGGELGRLPEDDEDGEIEDQGDDSGEYSSEEYSDEEEWEYEVPPIEEEDEEEDDRPHVLELRQLLRECQAMAEDRDDSSPFAQFIGPALNIPLTGVTEDASKVSEISV